MDAFTTLVSPFDRAIPAMISSAAFPKVALSNPPRPSPTRVASASVARPIQPATGMIPRAEQTKSAVGLMPPGQKRRTIASGTKIRSQSSDGLSFKSLEISRLASANQPAPSSASLTIRFTTGLHHERAEMNQESRNPEKNRSGTSFSRGFLVSRFEYKQGLI